MTGLASGAGGPLSSSRNFAGAVLPAMVAVLGIASATQAFAQGSAPDRNPGVIYERYQPLVVDGDLYPPPSYDDELEHADEVAFARALSLIQTARVEEGLEVLRQLRSRYPGSRRLVSATASALTLSGRPQEALRVLDEAGRRQKGSAAREGEARGPRTSAEPFAPERAEALLAMGRRVDAIPSMVEASSQGGPVAGRFRSQLLSWAEVPDIGPKVAAMAARKSDADLQQIDLALLAAEIEARAGRPERAWERLRKSEARTGTARKGELLRVLAERISADSRPGSGRGADSWLELARGPYDPALRAEAFGRLLAMESASAEPGLPASDPRVSGNELESAWRSLPEGEVRTRIGLQLVDHLRRRGQEGASRRVSAALGQTAAPADLAGDVELESGIAAIQRGDLADAQRRLLRARAGASSEESRERAEYELAETWFYQGRFDSALAGFDAFSQANPQSPLANDALERAYLLEGDSPDGGGGPRPGLEALARGLYAEARQSWDEAARLARDADAEARAARQTVEPLSAAEPDSDAELQFGPRDPVRSHSLLLLSRAEEKRGAFDAALAAALLVSDSLSGDRLAPLARKRAGDLLYSRGRHDEALRQYEEMLARYPRSWLASEVRRRVTELRSRRTP